MLRNVSYNLMVMKCDTYLGNIFCEIKRHNSALFTQHYDHVNEKANNTVFGANQTLSKIKETPLMHVMLYIFDSLVLPVSTYDSDEWRTRKAGTNHVAKVYIRYMKRCLV